MVEDSQLVKACKAFERELIWAGVPTEKAESVARSALGELRCWADSAREKRREARHD